jgi:hypothetical protein
MRFTVSVSINVVIAFVCVLMGLLKEAIAGVWRAAYLSTVFKQERGEGKKMTYDLASRKKPTMSLHPRPEGRFGCLSFLHLT